MNFVFISMVSTPPGAPCRCSLTARLMALSIMVMITPPCAAFQLFWNIGLSSMASKARPSGLSTRSMPR